NDTSLWSESGIFVGDAASITSTQAYIQGVIEDARKQVFGDSSVPDTSSIYYPFWQAVTSDAFTGILSLNANIQLTTLPPAIRAVLGGMTAEKDGVRVSNIDAFRAHHVGIEINDTDPKQPLLGLSQSSLFGLVDYEKPDTKK